MPNGGLTALVWSFGRRGGDGAGWLEVTMGEFGSYGPAVVCCCCRGQRVGVYGVVERWSCDGGLVLNGRSISSEGACRTQRGQRPQRSGRRRGELPTMGCRKSLSGGEKCGVGEGRGIRAGGWECG